MRPQRALERHERNQHGEKHPKILDRFNDREENRYRYRHPTKGYRTFTLKRSKAAMITAEIKKGMFPLPIISWQKIKEFLKSDKSL